VHLAIHKKKLDRKYSMKITAISLILMSAAFTYYFISSVSERRYVSVVTAASPSLRPKVKRSVDARAMIQTAARKHNVPVAFVRSIMAAESNFDPQAISPKGAVGLMQLMPETAREYGADPAIPEQNIDAGTRYLGTLLKRYGKYRDGLRRAIAAYNAGPAAVDRYRGVPPFRETRRYVTRVLAYLRQKRVG
jgi:soluble lytic murein transglycosylase-like protein